MHRSKTIVYTEGMDTRRSETWFFVALLAIVLFLSWLMLAPFVSALVIAGTFAFLLGPSYQKFLRVFRYESVAALVMVVLVALVVFLPLGFLGLRMFGEATTLYFSLASHGGFDFGVALNTFLHAHFQSLHMPDIVLNFNAYAQQGLTWLIQNLGSFFSGVAQIFFMAFLSLLGLFYFLKDGARLKKWMLEIIPLDPKDTEEIMHEVEAVGSSVVKGTLLVAAINGIIMGVGFFLFNIPDPTFWGTLIVPVSIIPVVGIWLVIIPAIAYLFFTGQTALGIGLAIWSAILVNLVYNVLSPQLMRRGANIHPYIILLSILGGIAFFGPIGFLIGPLVVALLLALLKIYKKFVRQ